MRLTTLVCLLFCSVPLWAEHDKNQIELSMTSKNYLEVYENPYVKAIRTGLTRYIQETAWRDSLKKSGVAAPNFPLRDSTCDGYYADSFSVIRIWPAQFGGLNGYILFKHKLNKVFRIWVYKIDENEYQLRQIEPAEFTQKEIDEIVTKTGKVLFAKSL